MERPGSRGTALFLSISLTISGIAWFIIGKAKEEGKAGLDWRGIAKLLKTPSQIILLTACFVLAMTRIGYLAGSILYLFLTFLWVSHFRLWAAIGLAILIGVGSWYFFQKILVIQLPAMGVWVF